MSDTTSWARMFDLLEIRWCQGCDAYDDYHENGFMVGRTFHWRDRRITRPGLYKTLRKVALGLNMSWNELPVWRQLYLINHEVLDLAKKVGLRLPRDVADLDRARLRYALSEYTGADRRRMTPSEQKDFRAAIRWAARS